MDRLGEFKIYYNTRSDTIMLHNTSYYSSWLGSLISGIYRITDDKIKTFIHPLGSHNSPSILCLGSHFSGAVWQRSHRPSWRQCEGLAALSCCPVHIPVRLLQRDHSSAAAPQQVECIPPTTYHTNIE